MKSSQRQSQLTQKTHSSKTTIMYSYETDDNTRIDISYKECKHGDPKTYTIDVSKGTEYMSINLNLNELNLLNAFITNIIKNAQL
jgi:hypothetical protein